VGIDGVLAALEGLPEDTDVPARLEQDVMRRVRGLATENPRATSAAAWWRGLAPALAAGAVAAGAILGLRAVADRDPALQRASPVAVVTRSEAPAVARRAKTRVPDEPPAELASRAELFIDLPMLRDLDKLQHFDSIATMDDDPTDAVPPPSNG
jgi:hypothetical protein